jgi:hypothetical protein
MLLTKMIYQLITESKNMKMQTAKDSMGITYFPIYRISGDGRRPSFGCGFSS